MVIAAQRPSSHAAHDHYTILATTNRMDLHEFSPRRSGRVQRLVVRQPSLDGTSSDYHVTWNFSGYSTPSKHRLVQLLKHKARCHKVIKQR